MGMATSSGKIFYLVTGMSGAGKSTALNCLEDSGFYCVDNLPVGLLDKFLELMVGASESRSKVAIAIDIRSGSSFYTVSDSLKMLDVYQIPYRILFLDCDDTVLLRRYKETRRKHPLGQDSQLAQAIPKERSLLAPLLESPNRLHLIDTTELKTKDLAQHILDLTIRDHSEEKFRLVCFSFGFKNGIPKDADFVFDVRFLQNPYYVSGMRDRRGTDPDVAAFVFHGPQAHEFVERMRDFLGWVLPNFIDEGRRELNVAIGCTGGHHRSVAIVEKLADLLQADRHEVMVRRYHRDFDR